MASVARRTRQSGLGAPLDVPHLRTLTSAISHDATAHRLENDLVNGVPGAGRTNRQVRLAGVMVGGRADALAVEGEDVRHRVANACSLGRRDGIRVDVDARDAIVPIRSERMPSAETAEALARAGVSLRAGVPFSHATSATSTSTNERLLIIHFVDSSRCARR